MSGYLGNGPLVGSFSTFHYIATSTQTVFSGADARGQTLRLQAPFVLVFVDGALLPPEDVTIAADGLSLTLIKGVAQGLDVTVFSAPLFSMADALSLTQNGGDILDKIAFRSQIPHPGALFGLTLSTAGSSATFAVAAGYAADSTNSRLMRLTSSISKTTSAWAAGTSAGALDTGSIANSTWYHVFEIMNVSSGTVDVIISATTTPDSGPTVMPTGYTLYRRIGSMKTNGSAQWTKFTQRGDEFLWDVIVTEYSAISLSTSQLKVFTVPLNIKVMAIINGQFTNAVGNTSFAIISPDITTPTVYEVLNPGNGLYTGLTKAVRTDTSGRVNVISSSGASNTFYGYTHGWIDDRGKNA